VAVGESVLKEPATDATCGTEEGDSHVKGWQRGGWTNGNAQPSRKEDGDAACRHTMIVLDDVRLTLKMALRGTGA
jgi:hypothetical protein